MRYMLIVLLLAGLAACSDQQKPAVPAAELKSDVELLRERIQKDPKDADALFHLAELYERAGLYQEAADALRKTVAAKPEMGYAHFKLGTVYNRLGRYEDAVASFSKATRYLPNQPMAYNNMAFSLGKLGRTGDEIQALKKAISSLRPGYSIAHFNLGMAYLREGRRDEALKEHAVLRDLDEPLAATLKQQITARRN
jgi:tetratricopeptide (TPR) repeat protein